MHRHLCINNETIKRFLYSFCLEKKNTLKTTLELFRPKIVSNIRLETTNADQMNTTMRHILHRFIE